MSDRRSHHRVPRHGAPATTDDSLAGSFLRKIHEHAPNLSQLLGYLTLIIPVGILLLVTGLTATLAVMGLIFVAPLIILTSPLWVPMATVAVIASAGLVLVGVFGFASLAGVSWMHKYFRGFRPPGSERADYARDRIYDAARFLQSKLKNVAPGAQLML